MIHQLAITLTQLLVYITMQIPRYVNSKIDSFAKVCLLNKTLFSASVSEDYDVLFVKNS